MASLKTAIKDISLIKTEGGFVNHKHDRGGPTKYGITLRTWKIYGWDINGDGVIDVEDLKLITIEDATYVYRVAYWDKLKAGSINDQWIANIVFDMGINSGKGTAIKKLQEQLNKQGFQLKVDGIIGAKTLKATNSSKEVKLYNDYLDARYKYYDAIVRNDNSQKVFINGWRNRLKKFVGKKKQTILGAGLVTSVLVGLGLYRLKKSS